MTPADYTPGAPIRTAKELAAWLAHEDFLYCQGELFPSSEFGDFARRYSLIIRVFCRDCRIRQALVKVRAVDTAPGA